MKTDVQHMHFAEIGPVLRHHECRLVTLKRKCMMRFHHLISFRRPIGKHSARNVDGDAFALETVQMICKRGCDRFELTIKSGTKQCIDNDAVPSCGMKILFCLYEPYLNLWNLVKSCKVCLEVGSAEVTKLQNVHHNALSVTAQHSCNGETIAAVVAFAAEDVKLFTCE